MIRFRSKVWIGTIAVILGAAGACNGHVAAGGSETNWLGACSDDDACSVGHCVCGVCTEQCEPGEACPVGLDTCATRGSAAFGRFCGAPSSGMLGLCAKGCGDTVPCARGFECDTGVCVPTREGDGSDGGKVSSPAPSATATAPQPGDGGLPTSQTTTSFVSLVQYLHTDPAQLNAKCLPRALQVESDGHVACTMMVASDADAGCDCNRPGYSTPMPAVAAAALTEMRQAGACDSADRPACSGICMCELQQASGAALTGCQSSGGTSATPAWCYVDPAAGAGDAALVDRCPDTQRRLLRFLGDFSNEALVMACSTTTENPAPSSSSPPGAIGDPCIPGDEANPKFSSFSESEVNVESGSPSCATGICLVNHFRGRVSCAYGQPGDGSVVNGLPRVDPAMQRCVTTGANSVPVEVPVAPQLIARTPEKSVYCSCPCDGPAGTGPFCACPGGFECAPLVDSYGTAGSPDAAGSYCIKAGTAVPDPSAIANSVVCSTSNTAPRPLGCGPL